MARGEYPCGEPFLAAVGYTDNWQVMDMDRKVLPELKKDVKIQELFSNTRKLALYPENMETLELSHFFVEKTTDVLEELIIHANFSDHDPRDHSPPATTGDAVDARELNDTATAPGVLSRTVFKHMLSDGSFEKATPFKNLKSLRLHRISLRYCADTWCKIVDFTKLQYLRLYQCPGADSLFGQMSKAANLPRQLKVLEVQHKDNAENEALMALDGFLCLVSGIRDLIIDMENVKTLPAAAGIARHGKTLELLNIHCSPESNHVPTSSGDDIEELVWDNEEFEKICKACTQLEQVSCAWPQTSLIRSPSEQWKVYEDAVMANLKGLVTLHISTFPTNKPSTQLLPRAIYEQLLQCLAQRLFELAANGGAKSDASTSAAENDDQPANTDSTSELETERQRNKLRLIAFGISEKVYEREDTKNQLIYLRSSCRSALGEEKVYAAPLGWCMRQFMEPRSDVLDFVLHRETRVPCREREGVHGGWGNEDDE